MSTLTDKERADLEAQHGELLVLDVRGFGDVAFRSANDKEFERYTLEHDNVQTRFFANKTLLASCLVYPSKEIFLNELVAKKPGAVITLVNELTTFVGMDKSLIRKK